MAKQMAETEAISTCVTANNFTVIVMKPINKISLRDKNGTLLPEGFI